VPHEEGGELLGADFLPQTSLLKIRHDQVDDLKERRYPLFERIPDQGNHFPFFVFEPPFYLPLQILTDQKVLAPGEVFSMRKLKLVDHPLMAAVYAINEVHMIDGIAEVQSPQRLGYCGRSYLTSLKDNDGLLISQDAAMV